MKKFMKANTMKEYTSIWSLNSNFKLIPSKKKEVPKQMKMLKNALQEQMLNSKDILFFIVTGIMFTRIRNLVSLFRNIFTE